MDVRLKSMEYSESILDGKVSYPLKVLVGERMHDC